jgi:erythronate-4-phosphate dehydrogenase
MIHITTDENIPFIRGVLEPFAKVQHLPSSAITSKRIRNSDALLIRTRTLCNKDLLEGTKVKFIATATIGTDHIDLEYCRQKNIAVSSAPGCNAESVNQYVASALSWLRLKRLTRFRNKKIGIVGVGNVGARVMKTARALGMTPMPNDPPRVAKEGLKGFFSLEQILNEAEIITLHVPLKLSGEVATYHLVGDEFLHQAQRLEMLINTSRGAVCNTTALANSAGMLRAMVHDVWENEPDIDRGLLQKTTLGTAHIAGYSVDGKANASGSVVRSLSRHFGLGLDDWKPENLAPPEKPVIELECHRKEDEEVIASAILHTYKISSDSERLKERPDEFEKLRNNYPPRREFNQYTCKLSHPSHTVIDSLKLLGFNILQ